MKFDLVHFVQGVSKTLELEEDDFWQIFEFIYKGAQIKLRNRHVSCFLGRPVYYCPMQLQLYFVLS